MYVLKLSKVTLYCFAISSIVWEILYTGLEYNFFNNCLGDIILYWCHVEDESGTCSVMMVCYVIFLY